MPSLSTITPDTSSPRPLAFTALMAILLGKPSTRLPPSGKNCTSTAFEVAFRGMLFVVFCLSGRVIVAAILPDLYKAGCVFK
ncbi:hypothetical protein D3C86_1893640 [compost metagenome]